ncbi:unnamed protein product [Phytophthora fragariaefolia]|uniref:Unnamed protein product n=1 Tax=Phytophthora fragariaefolia TaxID=1490495 RepID=A0A9W6TNI7_9STRA|nr:unnamed protein product [Phytophthora fragariaefolia]
MSMRDYVQKARHLVLCIATNPIDVASQVHAFIYGMRDAMTRYCLTRAEPATLEAAFALGLREDYTVASSYARALTPDARVSTPEPMEIDAIEAEASPPPVLHLHFNATTTCGDSRLILISLNVVGAERPLRALLDSGATNNFIRGDCLALLPPGVRVRNGPSEIVVKLEDGKSHRAPRQTVLLGYTFDGFSTNDDFLVIEMNYAFDCILGMPWLARNQPEIVWLARSVRRRADYDVSQVFTHLIVAPPPRVAVMDHSSTTQLAQQVCDGPRCLTCAATVVEPTSGPSSRAREDTRNYAVGQRLPREDIAVEQRLPREDIAVEKRLPRENTAVEQRLPVENYAVEQRLQFVNTSVEQRLPFADVPVAQAPTLRDAGVVKIELPGLEGGMKCHPANPHPAVLANTASDDVSSSRPKAVEPMPVREEHFAAQFWTALQDSNNPVYSLAREFEDIFPEKVPAELRAARVVRYEIDLVPGPKYFVTRQWPLSRDQVQAIDDFFEGRRKAGHVRERTLPHSSPTFCVKKVTVGWCIVHAFNKLNDATIPAQTPIPHKDMVLDTMSRSVIFRAIDLTEGFYQILMRESDIPLPTVSTPSGMLWEWLRRRCTPPVSTSGVREDAPNKLYANLKKCVFCAPEIPVLGRYVSRDGVRADPEKISSICSWPTPKNQTELRQWLGLANYLHKYTKDYASLIQPMSSLLKKDVAWDRRPEHQDAFEAVKKSLASAPFLMLPDTSRPFHVVCDASDFAIGCALMQFHDEGRARVVSYQSRQMKPAERNYPVHDKELLAMRNALIKFSVYQLGEQTLAVYTDHASLRTGMKSPHLSQREARWLSFFAEHNFVVHYKPGKNNILADALSRRPDYDPRRLTRYQGTPDNEGDEEDCAVCVESGINTTVSSPVLPLRQQIADAYDDDAFYAGIIRYLRNPTADALAKLTRPTRDTITRYALDGDLLTYGIDTFDTPRVVIPVDDDLRARLVHEYHDAPAGGHLGRETTFTAISRDFFRPRMFKWIRKWVRSCEVCQRVKPAAPAPHRHECVEIN